ncbi:dTMP kinase [Gammaproteobacteria bacterium 53_120_T64]|nr:dTMP kinase [Gammaproteobacteria bacterium 53_120_T64]
MIDTTKGKFISVEGTEGVGKTTNIRCIEKWLEARGIAYIATREPGGTALGEKIRALLLDKDNSCMAASAELLLMFAARAQHLQEKIIPALAAGTWVLCDRFTDATYAYQGFGRGLNREHIQQLETLVQAGLHPDFTLILDIDPELGMSRVRARGELDRFESEAMAFFDRVRAGYRERAAENPARYHLVDASAPLVVVQEHIVTALNAFVGEG